VEHFLAHLLDKFTYLAIVAILSAAGLGVPVSEDLTLLIGGGLAAGYCGVIFGDVLIHHWGTRMGPAAFSQKWVQKLLSPEREEKLRQHFARHAFLTIVVGRHTPVLRAPVFFLAGASKVPRWEFVIADAISAAITVPIVVTLGYFFAEHLDDIRQKIHNVQWVMGGAAAVLILAWLLWRRRRRGNV
jgi:membrane protein DedA with SNARE-associated domain